MDRVTCAVVSEATLEWVLSQTGADSVAEIQPLAGGITSTMSALRLRGGEAPGDVVLREMTVEPWRAFASQLLRREAATLTLLARTDVPAPRLISVDPQGERASEPSLLMTRLGGEPDRARPNLDALAQTLVRIHSVVASPRPRAFELWTDPSRWIVPSWAAHPPTFEAAFARVKEPLQPTGGCFLHRDYQPGNVLFADDGVSGVVDWVETSWGPPDLDVAHCGTVLALMYAPDIGHRWPDAYRAAGGRLSVDFSYWAVIDAVSFLPEPAKLVSAWTAAGRSDLSDDLVRRRHEEHLAALVG